jgi:hypothetical protein
MTDLTALPWRQGRHRGRHMYAQLGPEPHDDDPDVGTLETAELAAEACESHNEALARRMAELRLRGAGVSGVTGVQFGDGNSQTNVF